MNCHKITNHNLCNKNNKKDYFRYVKNKKEREALKKIIKKVENTINISSDNSGNVISMQMETKNTDVVFYIQNFTNLISLNLRNCNIKYIYPIAKCTKLKILNISINQISYIYPLKNLKNLEILNLGNNQISDFSVLKSLKKLKCIDLNNNKISDISSVKQMKNLIALDISRNNILDFSHLKILNFISLLLIDSFKINIDIDEMRNKLLINFLKLKKEDILNLKLFTLMIQYYKCAALYNEILKD